MATNIISNLACTEFLDALASIYLKLRGSDPAGAGAPSNPNGFGLGLEDGNWGAASLVEDVVQAVVDAALVGVDGIDPIVALGQAAQNLKSRINTKTVAANLLTDPIGALRNHIAAAQIEGATDIDSFLTVRNTVDPSKWQIMVPPAFALLYKDVTNTDLSKENVWFEVLQGSVYTNALGKLIVGTGYSDGFSIDNTYYAGGFPKIKVVGVAGTGVITVTGTAFNPANKQSVTGKTWVYNLVEAVDGTYALAPGGGSAAPSNSLILDVTGVAVDPSITAGTIYVEAHRPTGRAAFAY